MQTTRKMIDAVRQVTDERDEANLSDEGDILPALQRGYDHAVNVISRHYVDALLAIKTIEPGDIDASGTFPIPSDAFEDRVLKVESSFGGLFSEVTKLNYTDLTPHETPVRSSVPDYYTVIGRRIKLTPAGSQPIRLWYAKHPGPLQLEQGRVTAINVAGNYVICSDIGTLSTNQSDLTSFVNIVDGSTGEIRATLQVQSVVNGRVTFKTTPSRTSIYGRDVTGAVPDNVSKDDYLCYAEGSVLPIIQHSVSNFLIQYAVLDVTKKLGLDPTVDKMLKDELSNNLEKLSFGREPDTRVKRTSRPWGVTSRRIWGQG